MPAPTAQTPADAGHTRIIQIVTGDCMGSCRSYMLHIHSDGDVVWTGLHNIPSPGPFRDRLSADALAALTARFEALHFFELDDTYDEAVADAPTSTITYWRNGRSKAVTRKRFKETAGVSARELERAVNDAVRIERWLGAPADLE